MRREFHWGRYDPAFTALTDRDIEVEWWASHFWHLEQSGQGGTAEEAVNILEAHGDEAFQKFWDDTMKMAAEADARTTGNTEPLPESP